MLVHKLTTIAIICGLLGESFVVAAGNNLKINARTGDSPDEKRFSEKEIHGRYGFVLSANVVNSKEEYPVPAAHTGMINFKSKGECVFTHSGNIGGENTGPWTELRDCTYKVRKNGLGEMTVGAPMGGSDIPIVFAITDNGDQLLLMRTDAAVATGTARRQRPQ